MADVASRPRTTDFAFMRRFNDDIDNSSTDNGDRSATAPDYSSLLAGSALYLDQRLNPGLSLGGNFDGTLQASQALLSSGNAGNLVPEITSATGAGTDEGPVSSEFQFPEMPAALLEQGPQYQYSAHTRTNVFAEGLPDDFAGLDFVGNTADAYELPLASVPYGAAWNSGTSGSVTADTLGQTSSHPERDHSSPSSASVHYGDQGSIVSHDASSAAHGFLQLSGYDSAHAFDGNQFMQQRHLPPSNQSYDGYYAPLPKASSDGSLYQQPAGSLGNAVDATYPQRSASLHMHQLNYNLPMGGSLQASPSTSRQPPNDNSAQPSSPKRMRTIGSTTATYPSALPHFSSPTAGHNFANLARSQPSQIPLQDGQGTIFDLSSSNTRMRADSGASSMMSTRYDSSLPQPVDRLSEQGSSVPTYFKSEWSDGVLQPVNRTGPPPRAPLHPFEADIALPTSSRSHRPLLVPSSISGLAGPSVARDNRTQPGSSSSTDGRASGRAPRKNVNGGGNGSTDDEMDDYPDAPPPNPRAVALAEAATTRQSGTQAQQDCLQALNETMNQSLEQDGVARCPFPQCTKTFAKHRSYNLKTHLRSHSQLKPFACSSCPRAFSRKHDLERHARVHSGDRPYICEVCGRGFPRSDALRRHWRVEKECGDRAGDLDSNTASGIGATTSQASGMTALAPMSFGGPGAEGEASGQVGADARYHNTSGSSFDGMAHRYGESLSHGMSSSSTLLGNGKRPRDNW